MLVKRAALLVCLAACEPLSPALEQQQQEILGGSADAGLAYPSVFLLGMTFPDAGSSICSAARVGKRTLVTAAHCIDPARRGVASVSVVAFNRPTDVGLGAADVHRMTEYRLHPLWNPAVESATYDIAMLLLDRVPDAGAPFELAREAPGVGQGITLVGYGRDDPADGNSSGTRRAVAASITAVDAGEFEFGTAGVLGICGGDSGGPALNGRGEVLGLHSITPDPAVCGDGTDTRVDVHAAFIDAFLAEKDPRPFVDAGTADAGSGVPDAGAPPLPPDAGQMMPADAGTGGGGEPPQGCGCTASAWPLALAAFALFVRSETRRRRLDTPA